MWRLRLFQFISYICNIQFMTTNNTISVREADIMVEKMRKRIWVVRFVLKTFRSNERKVLTTNNIGNQWSVISILHICLTIQASLSNSVHLIYNVIVLIKDQEWLQIFDRFLFWTFDERPYSCRQKLNISGDFETFFFTSFFLFKYTKSYQPNCV